MAELSMEEMVKAIYEKVVVGSDVTPFGVKGHPSGGQVAAVVPPEPLTEDFIRLYWYNTILGVWQPAGSWWLAPNQAVPDGVISPAPAPEGWEWNYNPETMMIAARKVC